MTKSDMSQKKEEQAKALLRVIEGQPADCMDGMGWVAFSNLDKTLAAEGLDYKELGFSDLRQFLDGFDDILRFRVEQGTVYIQTKMPTNVTSLFQWAWIPCNISKYKRLAALALPEKWYYGDDSAHNKEMLPILRNYLEYTFRRLSFEKKVKVGRDVAGEEYASFNTGLVDKKYECIYALLKKNTNENSQYWSLNDFIVASDGRDGKKLVGVFNPLPERADYFEGKIQNIFYDLSSGRLWLDYDHIILENIGRFPPEFLQDNCPPEFLCINGVSIDKMVNLRPNAPARLEYFDELRNKISNTQNIYNRLKSRIDDAIRLTEKRIQWNYKTAIPIYFPTGKTCSLLLPLCLMNEDHVDLALVVTREHSGAYVGQTILTLRQAYTDSRLITRPDSDWLKTETIAADGADELDDND